jgi:hypothetical protein
LTLLVVILNAFSADGAHTAGSSKLKR